MPRPDPRGPRTINGEPVHNGSPPGNRRYGMGDGRGFIELGRCRGMDPNIFVTDPESRLYERNVEIAKAVCSGCPVKGECLEYALRNREFGVWGGTDEKDRRRIRRLRVQAERVAGVPPRPRTPGPGSMKEVSPGKWRLRVFVGPDPITGRPRQPSFIFYGTEAEAAVALARFRAAERAAV